MPTLLKRLWQLHSWVGLICGAGLLVIGTTGSLLVFHDEIEALVHPQMIRAQPTPAGRLPLDDLLGRMQRALPDYEITFWVISRVPKIADTVYVVRHGESETRFATIDPFRGEILAAPTALESSFTGWMLDLHYKFFAGKIGVAITFLLALMLCFLGVSGFWLYRGFWKNFVRLRWRKSGRIFFSDFHKMIGISSVILNLLLGITGGYLNFLELSSYFRSGNAAPPRPVGKFYSDRISFEDLLGRAQQKLPGFDPSYFALPAAPKGSIIFAGKIRGQSSLRSDYGSSTSFDPQTGALRSASDIRGASALGQILDTVVPLHFGTFGGVPVKILWCSAGLTPALLALSGFLVWRSRTRRR